jgi:hypothetical protein
MDYSAVEEHPESSPWATSPQHNRTSFEAPPQSPGFQSTVPQHAEDDDEEHTTGFSAPSEPHQEPAPESEQPQPSSQATVRQPAAPTLKQAPAKRTRQERPHYKLQAKITGLERNSRKDPLFKFDVYVG